MEDQSIATYRALVHQIITKVSVPQLRACVGTGAGVDAAHMPSCRTAVLDQGAGDEAALSLLAAATVPPRFAALNSSLHDAIVLNLADDHKTLAAIDSGDPAMMAAFEEQDNTYSDKLAPLIAKIDQ